MYLNLSRDLFTEFDMIPYKLSVIIARTSLFQRSFLHIGTSSTASHDQVLFSKFVCREPDGETPLMMSQYGEMASEVKSKNNDNR